MATCDGPYFAHIRNKTCGRLYLTAGLVLDGGEEILLFADVGGSCVQTVPDSILDPLKETDCIEITYKLILP